MKPYVLEVCAGDVQSAEAARRGGAARVELCAALAEGGVTPSAAFVREVCKMEGLAVHVLIRPRGGDFLYDEQEVRMMVDDILLMREWGADGVVIGALTSDGQVDTAACRRLADAAGGLHVTFHRAFDLCRDPFEALEVICDLGCDRLLTSGQAQTAEAGIPLLRELVRRSEGRLSVMPGSGVSAKNARRILAETGASELHASARRVFHSAMAYRRPGVNMGVPGMDEFARKATDEDEVRALLQCMNG